MYEIKIYDTFYLTLTVRSRNAMCHTNCRLMEGVGPGNMKKEEKNSKCSYEGGSPVNNWGLSGIFHKPYGGLEQIVCLMQDCRKSFLFYM